MQDAIKNYEDVDSWKTIMFLYNAALKEVETKLEILMSMTGLFKGKNKKHEGTED